MRQSQIATLVLCGLAGALLNGCGSSNNSSPPTSHVRTVNSLVPATGTTGQVTVTANNSSLSGTGTGLGFGQTSPTTGFTNVTSGTFTPTGVFTPTGGGSTVPLSLANNTSTLAFGQNYTLAATGQVGTTGTTAPGLTLIPGFTGNLNTIPTGNAAVRVVNLSPGANSYGLYSSVSGTPALVNNGLNNVAYGFNSATNQYVTVPTSTLNSLSLQNVATPGVTSTLGTSSNLSGFTFAPRNAYTVYITGQEGNTSQPLNATVVNDTTGS